MSGGMAWTIRGDSLELWLWPGLVLHGMGEVDFHVFWKYWKVTSKAEGRRPKAEDLSSTGKTIGLPENTTAYRKTHLVRRGAANIGRV